MFGFSIGRSDQKISQDQVLTICMHLIKTHQTRLMEIDFDWSLNKIN